MNNYFQFKRFTVQQAGAAMKVGTDGVLLGAWCDMTVRPARVLDIGTGTGLIALMAAQRGEAWGCCVDAVEIDPSAAQQARENFHASPWAERLTVYCTDIKGVKSEELGIRSYDLIVSNPPFFRDSLQAPEVRRNMARHGVALSYAELAQAAAALLNVAGRFAVIVPFDSAAAMIAATADAGLVLQKRCDVQPLESRPPHRSMLLFSAASSTAVSHETLIIEHSPSHFTEEYRTLTQEFYLQF